jgi:hypothetical protein
MTRDKKNGLTWGALPLGASDLVRAEWAADGRSFFVLTSSGVLRCIAYPSLQELRKINLQQRCQTFGFCKLGLLVTLEPLQEIWIVDPDTFAVVKRLGITQLEKVLTGPSLVVAYVFSRDSGYFTASTGLPIRINLEDGTLAAMTTSRDPAVKGWMPSGFGSAALSPDGKWLFGEGGPLLRFRIDGTSLILDGRSHRGVGSGHRTGICVSPDSQWVCLPTGGGNDGLLYGTYVYHSTDLSQPAFDLKQGAYPNLVGFDPAGKRVFTQSFSHPLMVFDHNGTKLSEHTLVPVREPYHAKQYAAHPVDGNALLLRTTDKLLLVEFTSAD